MKRQILRSIATVLAVVVALVAVPIQVSADGPPTTPILRLELGMHSALGRQVGTDAQGRFVITSSYDKTSRLWDTSNGQLLRIYRVPSGEGSQYGMLYGCALSPDGRIAAIGGVSWENTVYLFDRQSGQMIRRLSGLSAPVEMLHFTADGEYLAAALLKSAKGGGYAVWRCRDWSLVGVDNNVGDQSYCLDFVRRDGAWTMAASCWDGKIRYYRLGDRLEKLYEYNTGTGKHPNGLSFNPDGGLLAVGYNDARLVQVLSVTSKEMKLAYTPDLANCSGNDLRAVRFSQDGQTLYASGSWISGGMTLLRIWSEAGAGSYRDLQSGATNSIQIMEAMPNGRLLIGGADPFWAVLDASGVVNMSVGSPIIAFSQREETRLGPGGNAISFNGEEKSAGLVGFDTATRSFIPSSSQIRWTSPDTTSLKLENWLNRQDPHLNGKPLTLRENHEWSRSIAVAPGSKQFILGSDWNLYSFDDQGRQLWKKAIPDRTRRINISDDGRLAVAALGDGTLRWYRLTDGQELLTLFPHPDGKRWVLWTPSGYYDASPGGEELIGWQVNNGMDAAADFYPAARFRSTYYRPDIVNLVLTTLDEKQAIVSANSEAGRRQDSGSILDKRPPIVLITSPDQGDTFSTDAVTLLYRLRAPDDAPVTSVRALVDGRPSESARGLTVVTAAEGDKSIALSLPARDCTVSIIAENKNGSSEAASVRLLWKGTAAVQDELVTKPKLYVLAVGVSEYQKPDYHLNYAAKDARDLTALLNHGSPLYRGVETKVLTDAAADKNDILDGLDWIEKLTTSRDIAVILFSGHGVNDSNGDYYYLPVEADIDRLKRTGLPFSDIRTTVSHIAGKVLFFIDTCHSGNLMASRAGGLEHDIVGVINDLSSAENGAIVFASSTGSQYSYEDSSWGNGAFTKALLEGLEGAAVYGNAKGLITVKRLDLYLSDRVKELTEGKQTPTTAIPPNIPDFPIAAKE